MQDNTWHTLVPSKKNSGIEITSVEITYVDGMPVICLGSTAGLEIYQSGTWIHLNVSKDHKKNEILSMTAKSRKFYVLSNDGMYEIALKKNGWNFADYMKFPGESIQCFRFENPGTPDEKLWLLSNDHLDFIQKGNRRLYANEFFLPQPDIPRRTFICFDHMGNVFFGNNWAKYFVGYQYDRPHPLLVGNGFSSNGATSVFVDREQNVWYTDTRGVDRTNNLLKINFFEQDGLLDNEVTAIVELKNGDMIFGHNNGLTLYDRRTFKRIPFKGTTNNMARVLDMMQDDHGNIWFAASSNGFGKLTSTGGIKWYKPDSTSIAVSVFQDKAGKLWMGSNTSLYLMQNDRLIEFAPDGKRSTLVRKIFSGKGDDKVLAGMSGLSICSGVTLKTVPVSPELNTESIYAYFRSQSGAEFIGTQNGLGIIQNGKVQKLNINGITVESPIYFIIQDPDQQYWLGSNNGVLRWDGKGKIESFTVQNGLAGRETNRSAGIVDSKGRVWIGTDKGVSCFFPGFADRKNSPPRVVLLGIEFNAGEIQSIESDRHFAFNENSVFFHFRGMSFVNEQLISYRFKLDGYEKDWQVISQSNLDKVKYASLHPGKFKLNVQARNDMGEWSEVVQSGVITIEPEFFQTLWFKIVVFITFCLIIIGIIQIIIQKKYSLKLEMEITERKKSEQKLSESRELYKLIADKMTDVVWLMDLNGKSLFVSNSIEQFTGFTVEEYLRQTIDDRFTPASSASGKVLFNGEIARLALQPEALHSFSYTYRMEYMCKDGRAKWGELLMTPYFGQDNQWLGIHGVTRDITERKMSEESLREKATELERFNNLMIGRELKMIELKKEINELLVTSGQEKKYQVHE
jgi:PAS domain S-box-containing protein